MYDHVSENLGRSLGTRLHAYTNTIRESCKNTISRKTFLAVPGKEKLKRMKLEVCENLAPSPPIFT